MEKLDEVLQNTRQASAEILRKLEDSLKAIQYTDEEMRNAIRQQDQQIYAQLLENAKEGIALAKEVEARIAAFKEIAFELDGFDPTKVDAEISEHLALTAKTQGKAQQYSINKVETLRKMKQSYTSFVNSTRPSFITWKEKVRAKADELQKKDRDLCLMYSFYADGVADANRPKVSDILPLKTISGQVLRHHEIPLHIKYVLEQPLGKAPVPKPSPPQVTAKPAPAPAPAPAPKKRSKLLEQDLFQD